MNKLYQKYLLIGLSTISVSLTGMEHNQQRAQLQQSDGSIWTLKPLGGYITLHPYLKKEMYESYNDHVEKAIHFIPVDCGNTNHLIYQYLKYRMGPVPLNLFTERDKSYTITTNNIGTFTIISDQVYDEQKFLTYKDHWNKIHSNNNQ